MKTIDHTKLGGRYFYEHLRNGEVIDRWEEPNIVVDEGLIYILNTAIGNVTQIPTFYLGLFKNNYTPIAGDTAAAFGGVGVANEANAEYDEATRPVFTPTATNAKVIANAATTFTFNTAVDIYGGFLISDAAKGGTLGTLVSASKFAAVRQMQILDELNVGYTLTIADA